MSDRSTIYQFDPTKVDFNMPIFKALEFIEADGLVLDVGCACGDNGVILKKERHVKLVGAEIDEKSADIAERTGAYEKVLRLNLELLNDGDLPEYRGAFDYVFCGDVIEHLRKPLDVLKKLQKYLKKDGRIIASIPNVSHIAIKSQLLLNDFVYTPTGLLDETHVHLFTYRTIATLFAQAGLVISDVRVTLMDRLANWYPCDYYKLLPADVKPFIANDCHGYVCQYVIKAVKSSDNPKRIEFDNLKKLDFKIDDFPKEFRDYHYVMMADAESENKDSITSLAAELEKQKAAAARVPELEATYRKLEADYRKLEVLFAEQKGATEEAIRMLSELRNSPSWRITAPLRKIKHMGQSLVVRIRLLKGQLRNLRYQAAFLAKFRGCDLIFDHNLGGGANEYRRQFIEKALVDGRPCILAHNNLYNGEHRDFSLKLKMPGWAEYNDLHFGSWAECETFLSKVEIGRIVYNNLVYNPSHVAILKWIVAQKCKVLLLMHDFFPVCQFYDMIDNAGVYCEGRKDCNACIPRQPDKRHLYDSPVDVEAWHAIWSPVFEKAYEVRIFSPFAERIIEDAYSCAKGKVVCVPHSMEYCRLGPVKLNPGNGPRIAVIGTIYNVAKGSRIVDELASELAPETLLVVGTYEGPAHDNIVCTGKFKREDIAGYLVDGGINMIFFPSVWPETFSYIVSEIMQMRIPLLAFDFGAQGDKVGGYDLGMIVHDVSAKGVLKAAEELYRKVYEK